jgi:hypothetical protein
MAEPVRQPLPAPALPLETAGYGVGRRGGGRLQFRVTR